MNDSSVEDYSKRLDYIHKLKTNRSPIRPKEKHSRNQLMKSDKKESGIQTKNETKEVMVYKSLNSKVIENDKSDLSIEEHPKYCLDSPTRNREAISPKHFNYIKNVQNKITNKNDCVIGYDEKGYKRIYKLIPFEEDEEQMTQLKESILSAQSKNKKIVSKTKEFSDKNIQMANKTRKHLNQLSSENEEQETKCFPQTVFSLNKPIVDQTESVVFHRHQNNHTHNENFLF